MADTQEFDRIIDALPTLLNNLQLSPAIKREDLSPVPERGIYVFYEDGKPIYVGRSRHLRSRLLEHSRTSSMHNAATFAFILAKERAVDRKLTFSSMKRESLQHDPVFSKLYTEAKERVAKMKVRVVQVEKPVEQTIFEVYAALELHTPYNNFDNH